MNMSKTSILKFIDVIKFNDLGLVPVIAQQFNTNEVLMLAWMNSDALSETIKTGNLCYWSRSRKKLWRKGEESGQKQKLKDLRWDCDADTLLVLVDQSGVACHTGRRSCFFNALREDKIVEISKVKIDPKKLYQNK
jgi:phosphoribosyl-AMP cyclohydrolase